MNYNVIIFDVLIFVVKWFLFFGSVFKSYYKIALFPIYIESILNNQLVRQWDQEMNEVPKYG